MLVLPDEKPLPGDTPPSSQVVSQQFESARDIATNAWQKVKTTATNALEATKQSVHSLVDYSYDKKDAFIIRATTELDSIDQKIKELSDKAATASGAVKADAQLKIQTLRDQRAVLGQKLDAAKQATETQWNEVKTAFQKAYDEVKQSCADAWQWLAEKMGA
jgi:hypothetical protein